MKPDDRPSFDTIIEVSEIAWSASAAPVVANRPGVSVVGLSGEEGNYEYAGANAGAATHAVKRPSITAVDNAYGTGTSAVPGSVAETRIDDAVSEYVSLGANGSILDTLQVQDQLTQEGRTAETAAAIAAHSDHGALASENGYGKGLQQTKAAPNTVADDNGYGKGIQQTKAAPNTVADDNGYGKGIQQTKAAPNTVADDNGYGKGIQQTKAAPNTVADDVFDEFDVVQQSLTAQVNQALNLPLTKSGYHHVVSTPQVVLSTTAEESGYVSAAVMNTPPVPQDDNGSSDSSLPTPPSELAETDPYGVGVKSGVSPAAAAPPPTAPRGGQQEETGPYGVGVKSGVSPAAAAPPPTASRAHLPTVSPGVPLVPTVDNAVDASTILSGVAIGKQLTNGESMNSASLLSTAEGGPEVGMYGRLHMEQLLAAAKADATPDAGHTALFESANPRNGLLKAVAASTLLRESGLEKSALRKVWGRAKHDPSVPKDSMNLAEFLLACKLVVKAGGKFPSAEDSLC